MSFSFNPFPPLREDAFNGVYDFLSQVGPVSGASIFIEEGVKTRAVGAQLRLAVGIRGVGEVGLVFWQHPGPDAEARLALLRGTLGRWPGVPIHPG